MAFLRKTAKLQWALVACVFALYLSSASARTLDEFDAFDDAWELDPLEAGSHLGRRSLLARYDAPPLPPPSKGKVVIPGNGPGGVGGGSGTPPGKGLSTATGQQGGNTVVSSPPPVNKGKGKGN